MTKCFAGRHSKQYDSLPCTFLNQGNFFKILISISTLDVPDNYFILMSIFLLRKFLVRWERPLNRGLNEETIEICLSLASALDGLYQYQTMGTVQKRNHKN